MLFRDPDTDRITLLLRMAAGARYPRHRHHGVEECLVLEGDLRFSDTVMLAGDFQRVEHGSVHPEHTSEQGCTLLLVAGSSEVC